MKETNPWIDQEENVKLKVAVDGKKSNWFNNRWVWLILFWPICVAVIVLIMNGIHQPYSLGSHKSYGISSKDAEKRCFDAFDHARGTYVLGSKSVMPWDHHATKKFRVVWEYKRDAQTFGFGCTVFSDGSTEVNYVE